MKESQEETANSRYLLQLTRKELVEVFSAVKHVRAQTTDPESIAFSEGIQWKLAQSQKNGPVPICENHQTPMVRVKGKHGPFWSCHQKDNDGNWCDYRPDYR